MEHVKFCFFNKNLSEDEKNILTPKRKSEWASGFDLSSAETNDITVNPGERALIPTGIGISLVPGLEAQIRSRSGLSLKNGIVVLNSPGTIDADYRGEIKIILANFGQEPFVVTFGMRIAQMIIAPVALCDAQLVLSLDESARGEGGFGSTGLLA